MRAGRTLALAFCLIGAAMAAKGAQATDSSTPAPGEYLNPAGPPPAVRPTTLPNGARIEASATTLAIQRYLASKGPASRTFDLPEVRFAQGMQVKAIPSGAIASMVALFNAYPQAKVRVQVLGENPGGTGPSQDSAGRARLVRQVFIDNGLPAARISAAGVRREGNGAPQVRLVVFKS